MMARSRVRLRGRVSSFNLREEGLMKAIFLGESECCWPLSVDLFRPEWPQLHTNVM